MTFKLTARQQQILDLIRQEIDRMGFPPTRAEIARALGFRSANAAEDHLKALARKGVIELTAGTSRGIRLLPPYATPPPAPAPAAIQPVATQLLALPVVGRVAAGSPILATQHVEQELHVQPGLFQQTPDYLLRVKGDSMINAGILEGDLLAVKKTTDARNGQIVVARLGDDVTVKRFLRQGAVIQLLPENPAYAPIRVTHDESFALEGLAVGLIRNTPLH